jgi:hypothetical protein
MSDALSHATSIAVAASASAAFAFVSDPARLDRWSFGTWKTTLHDGGLVEGRAIFDDAVTWVRIDADPARLLVDYHLGARADALVPRAPRPRAGFLRADLDRVARAGDERRALAPPHRRA